MLTIIYLQTQTNHVNSLQQSTKTKQMISQPKVIAEFMKLLSDHHVNNNYSANRKETHNSITKINRKETNDLATQVTCLLCETRIWSCLLWYNTPWPEQTLSKIGIYCWDRLAQNYLLRKIFGSGHFMKCSWIPLRIWAGLHLLSSPNQVQITTSQRMLFKSN